MNTTLVKIETKGQKGPIKFNIEMMRPGDLVCFADIDSKVDFKSYIWKNSYNPQKKKAMIFTPKKALEKDHGFEELAMLQIDKNVW